MGLVQNQFARYPVVLWETILIVIRIYDQVKPSDLSLFLGCRQVVMAAINVLFFLVFESFTPEAKEAIL